MESSGTGTGNGIEVTGNGTGYGRGYIPPVLPDLIFDQDEPIFIPF
jgi:hypothetical protein